MIQKTRSTYDFEEVYRKYYLRLYYFAYDFVEDIDISKDIVNEVFETVWKNWQQIDQEKQLREPPEKEQTDSKL